MANFTNISNTKIHTEPQRPQSHAILSKKNKAKAFTPSNFKIYYKAEIIKAVRYWYRNRHIGQWNKVESQKCVHS